jgi:hypothetical protein
MLGVLRRVQVRLTESRIALEKAITLDPNNVYANRQLAWTLLFLAEPDAAITRGEKSLRLSPRDPYIFAIYQLIGWSHLISNRVDEAIDLLSDQGVYRTPGGLEPLLRARWSAGAQGRPRRGEGGACRVAQTQTRGQFGGAMVRISAVDEQDQQPAVLGAGRQDLDQRPAPHRVPGELRRVAQGRAFVHGGIGDQSGGSREAVTTTTTRRLAAIFAADVAGYSRLMGSDEEGTLNRLKAHRRELVDPKITEHHGRIVKTTEDGMLVEFSSVVDAVRCAVEIQRAMVDRTVCANYRRASIVSLPAFGSGSPTICST